MKCIYKVGVTHKDKYADMPTYTIDEIRDGQDDFLGEPKHHYEKIEVHGDKALRDRIIKLLKRDEK